MNMEITLWLAVAKGKATGERPMTLAGVLKFIQTSRAKIEGWDGMEFNAQMNFSKQRRS